MTYEKSQMYGVCQCLRMFACGRICVSVYFYSDYDRGYRLLKGEISQKVTFGVSADLSEYSMVESQDKSCLLSNDDTISVRSPNDDGFSAEDLFVDIKD